MMVAYVGLCLIRNLVNITTHKPTSQMQRGFLNN